MNNDYDTLPSEGFVRLKQVLAVFPISKTAWYEGVRSGIYPVPIKLSERTSAYKVEDIRALLASISKQSQD